MSNAFPRAARKGLGRAIGPRMALIAAMSAMPAMPVLVSPAAAQGYSFSSVTVQGNQRIDQGAILSYAGIRPGQTLSAGALNDAYQNLLNSGLFESVTLVPRGDTLVIQVTEWPIVNIINIEGNSRFDDEELAELVQTVPRRVYDPAQAEADAAAIAQYYQTRGRLGASVVPKIIPRAGNRVDLVFEVTESGVIENERVSFVGNRDFSDRRLRRVLETKQAGLLRTFIQSDTFVAERLDFDRQLLTDFYNSRGYIDFRVLSVNSELTRDRSAFLITYNVQEGRSFDIARVTATSAVPGLDAAQYLAVSNLRRGQTYSPMAIETTITRMENLAIRRGLNFIRATPQITRNDAAGTLDVNFLLERGPRIFVERIDIEGNQSTLDRVIRREFTTVEGDPFNPRQIRRAAERIRALGYFTSAEVEAREGTSPDQVIVDVDVEEQPTGTLSFGGSYSADTGPGLNLGYSERNFLGRGQTLRFEITTGTDNASSQLTFIEPAFLARDIAFQFDAFYDQTNQENARFDTRVVGFSPSLTFPVSENGRLSLRYRLSEDTISNVGGDLDEGEENGSSPILLAEEGSRVTSSLGYTYSYDTRRTGLTPGTGILLRFGQDFAGVGGDSEYVRTSAAAVAQTLVRNEEVTLRATLEGGAINSLGGLNTRVTDRFFLSTNQLRGFAPLGVGPRDLAADNEDPLGGNFYASLRLEAEFPLGLPEEYGVSGGVFADAGSVWGLDDSEGANGVTVDDGFHLRSSVGVSIFWTTPIGPLRFNFAQALQKEDYDETQVFNFTVSTEF